MQLLKIGEQCELSKTELRIASYVGRSRHEYNESQNIRDQRASKKMSSIDIHIQGAEGELAFCKLAGTYPHLTIQENKYTDIDTVLPGGVTVDVKTTNVSYGRLLVSTSKKLNTTNVGCFALMLKGAGGVYQFRGYMPTGEVLKENRIDKKLPRPAYAVAISELWDLASNDPLIKSLRGVK
jgi:hypothetical protein